MTHETTRHTSRRRGLRLLAPVLAALLLAMLAGCASTVRVQQELEQRISAGDYAAAIELVDEERDGVFKGKNRLLYHLERGMLLHVDGRYEESNVAFEEAKRIGNALYTRSVTAEGLSLMTNDYATDYAGENFERTLIHLFSALNYLQLEQTESALVEIRQVGDYLKKLEIDSPNENTYRDDAFARYLSALLYELAGEHDAALVDYKKALEAYSEYAHAYEVEPPTSILPNAERVASGLGVWAQADLRERGSPGQVREIPPGFGELVVLHYNGLSPIKDQDRITVPFSEAWPLVAAVQASADDDVREDVSRATFFASQINGDDVVSVAFPKLVDRPYSIRRMSPRVSGATRVTGPELVEDIGAIAEKDLADRIDRIRAKAIARAAIKFAIQKGAEIALEQAGGNYGSMLSIATKVVGNTTRYLTEQADKRIWSTLPDQIWMSSMVLPAGTHDLEVDFLDGQASVLESKVVSGIEIEPGDRRFVMLRTAR